MNHAALFYTLLLLITAGMSMTTGIMMWHRRSVPAAIPLSAFMMALFVWSLSYAIFWMSETPQSQVFWLNMTYVGVVSVPVCFLLFTLHYTHHDAWVNRYTVLWLLVEPVITLVLLWTDPLHDLFFGGMRLPSSSTIMNGGIWFWIHVIYSYSIVCVVIVLLVRTYRRSNHLYRGQVAMMLFAISVPLISNVVGILNLNPAPDLDWTPFAFMVTGLIFIYALFYRRLFDVVPVARDKVLETMQEPVFVLDNQDRLVDINPSAELLLKSIQSQPDKPLLGEKIHTLLPAQLDGNTGDTLQKRIEIGDGIHKRFYEFRLSLLIDSRHTPMGKVLVFNDITRRIQMQQRELEIKLEKERVRLLAEFVRDASHEFRTPLAAINASAYLAARLADPPLRFEKAALVEQYVGRLTTLLDTMLLMTSLEASALASEPIKMAELLHDLCGTLPKSPTIPRISCAVDPNLPVITGDSKHIAAALRQILDNACRFTPPEGMVTVKAAVAADWLVVEVEDTGAGIAANELPHIFDMFWRRDSAHATPGLGLGLPIARKIIHMHGGEIEVESQIGKGSVFTVRLPILINPPE